MSFILDQPPVAHQNPPDHPQGPSQAPSEYSVYSLQQQGVGRQGNQSLLQIFEREDTPIEVLQYVSVEDGEQQLGTSPFVNRVREPSYEVIQAEDITIQTPLLALSNHDSSKVQYTDRVIRLQCCGNLLPVPKVSEKSAYCHLVLNVLCPPLGLIAAAYSDESRHDSDFYQSGRSRPSASTSLLKTSLFLFILQVLSFLYNGGLAFNYLTILIWSWSLLLSLLSLSLNKKRLRQLEELKQEECRRYAEIFCLNEEAIGRIQEQCQGKRKGNLGQGLFGGGQGGTVGTSTSSTVAKGRQRD